MIKYSKSWFTPWRAHLYTSCNHIYNYDDVLSHRLLVAAAFKQPHHKSGLIQLLNFITRCWYIKFEITSFLFNIDIVWRMMFILLCISIIYFDTPALCPLCLKSLSIVWFCDYNYYVNILCYLCLNSLTWASDQLKGRGAEVVVILGHGLTRNIWIWLQCWRYLSTLVNVCHVSV